MFETVGSADKSLVIPSIVAIFDSIYGDLKLTQEYFLLLIQVIVPSLFHLMINRDYFLQHIHE